ncbi:MAG: aryl-sulfate sulfotransferase [Actinobacteria bacterium]|nr:aryl-sulfate sulfotransferase [Actinomycetota bacterium]MCL5771705.1 aryl-sulfate sulfotransferase [Actinomycetota bacterium]
MSKYFRQITSDVTIHDESKVYNGYTLFAPQFANRAWLVDMKGNICHYWDTNYPPGVNYCLMSNGNLMWAGKGQNAFYEELGGCGTEIIELDWDGNEIWRYDDPNITHDFKILKNGNIAVLRFVLLPEEIQKKVKGGVPGTELPGGVMAAPQIREINRNKEIVWEWNGWKHFNIDKHVICPICDRFAWGYPNSIDEFENGDLIISLRDFNEVARIDRKTSEIIWEWGQDHELGHQHDVSVLANGNITIFDNGLHNAISNPGKMYELSSFCTSRALEVNPKNNEIVWEYIDPMHLLFSNFCGSVQKLPNGNYLVCEARTGTLYEITYEKEIVWKYVSPIIVKRENIWGWSETKYIFQAHRYSIDFEGFKNRDLDPNKYEWIIQKKSKESIEEEEIIKNRLAKAGY